MISRGQDVVFVGRRGWGSMSRGQRRRFRPSTMLPSIVVRRRGSDGRNTTIQDTSLLLALDEAVAWGAKLRSSCVS
jgi:hypothetical protein